MRTFFPTIRVRELQGKQLRTSTLQPPPRTRRRKIQARPAVPNERGAQGARSAGARLTVLPRKNKGRDRTGRGRAGRQNDGPPLLRHGVERGGVRRCRHGQASRQSVPLMLFDTDILVWVQRGNRQAAQLIDGAGGRRISVRTYMELLQAAKDKRQHAVIKQYVRDLSFVILQ